MDSLRIILILIGLGIIAGLYIWDRHKRQTQNLRYGKWRRDYQQQAEIIEHDDDEEEYFPADDTEEDYDDFVEDARDDNESFERVEPVLQQQPLFEEVDKDAMQATLDSMREAIDEKQLSPVYSGVEREPVVTTRELEAAEQIIAFNILADFQNQNITFKGPELLRQFDAHGLQFGSMNIYHYHKQGMPVFSVVNILEPGVFNLEDMGNFETPGLVVFMQLPNAIDPMLAFDRMLDTSRSLASALQGELRDDNRSVLTRQAIDRLREIIAEYNLKKRTARQE